MRTRLIMVLFTFAQLPFQLFCTITYTVGSSGANYTTISAAYNSCTLATNYVIRIRSNYNYNAETASGTSTITLGNLTNKSDTNKVIIMPDANVSLSFTSTASSLFTLNGATWIVFDGRANGTGASAWTLINSSPSASKRVFTFVNGASNISLKYLQIKGANIYSSAATAGLVLFSTSSASIGNSNNTIDNCSFNKQTYSPASYIVSLGTAGSENVGNVVSNCSFVDASKNAIWINANSNDYTIQDNHFFQLTDQTLANDLQFICLETGSSYIIERNYFGGKGMFCSGGAFVLLSSNFSLYCINIKNVLAGQLHINGNYLQNFSITSMAAGSASDASNLSAGFSAIFIQNSVTSVCEIGTISSPNQIGNSTSGTLDLTNNNSSGGASSSSITYLIRVCSTASGNSIQHNKFGNFELKGSVSKLTFYPIYVGGGSLLKVKYNVVGNEVLGNIHSSMPVLFSGIHIVNALSFTIENNTVQNIQLLNATSKTLFNGIHVEASSINNSTSTISSNTIGSAGGMIEFSGVSVICGINYRYLGQKNALISNNVIQQFQINGSGIGNFFYGIRKNMGNGDITSNIIRNINSNNTSNVVKLIGISSSYNPNVTSVNGSISYNQIYELNALLGGGGVYGISTSGGIVFKNKIYHLHNIGTLAGAEVVGIADQYSSPSYTALIYNNVILCDNETNGYATIIGIKLSKSFNPSNVYHNTIKIEGNAVSGTANSYALYSNMTDGNALNIQRIKNNIFYNTRTNVGASGKHYAEAYLGSAGTIDSDYNYLETAPAHASTIGMWNGVDNNLATFKSNSGATHDQNAVITINTSGTVAYATTNDVKWNGTNSIFSTVMDDFMGNVRNNAGSGAPNGPWMGAFEIGPDVLPIKLLSFTAKAISSKEVEVSWNLASETDNAYFTVEKSRDGISYFLLATLEGKGNSVENQSYGIIDTTPSSGIIYYRLRQTDFDGISTLYDPVSVLLLPSITESRIYPNPNKGDNIYILNDENGIPEKLEKVEIMTIHGIKIRECVPLSGQVSLLQALQSGVYYMLLSYENKQERLNFIVQ